MAAWIDHIREDHGRPEEDIVLKLHPSIHGDIILNLYPVTNPDTRADNDVLTEITVASDPRAGHDMTEMPNLGANSNFTVTVDNCRWIGEVFCRCFMNLNRYRLSVQRSLTGIQHLQHLHAISAIGARSFACDNTFNQVLTFFPEGLVSWKLYCLTLSFMRDR